MRWSKSRPVHLRTDDDVVDLLCYGPLADVKGFESSEVLLQLVVPRLHSRLGVVRNVVHEVRLLHLPEIAEEVDRLPVTLG